jgi:hypothetical protein
VKVKLANFNLSLKVAATATLLTFLPINQAHAVACVAGDTGKQRYNAGVMEFCNGTVWKDMTVSTGAACAAGDAGKVQYSAGAYSYCNGANWKSMKGASTGTGCAAGDAGKQRYSSNEMQFCDGTSWFAMVNAPACTDTATNFTWTGLGGDTNWDTVGNWYNNTPPGSGDVAIFNCSSGANSSVTVNVDPNVYGVSMAASFNGTISQGSGVLMNIGFAGWDQAGGTFTGSNANIIFMLHESSGEVYLHGGTFTSTSATMSIGLSGGAGATSHTIFRTGVGISFYHNNGTVKFNPEECWNCDKNFFLDIDGTITFYDVILDPYGYWSNFSGVGVSSGTAIVAHNFTLTDGAAVGGTWEVYGNISVSAWHGWQYTNELATVKLKGSANQTYAWTGGQGWWSSIALVIDKTGGTVTQAAGTTDVAFGTLSLVLGSFTAPSGTMVLNFQNATNTGLAGDRTVFTSASGFTFNHNNGRVYFAHYDGWSGLAQYTIDLPTSLTFYDVTISTGSGWASAIGVAPGDTMIVAHELLHNYGNIFGSFEIKGNLIEQAKNAGDANTGSANYTFTGTANQTIYYIGNAGGHYLPNGGITINKPSGTVTLTSNLFWYDAWQELTVTSGTLDMYGYNLTVPSTLHVGPGGTVLCNGGTLSYGSLDNTGGTVNCAAGTHTFTSVGSFCSSGAKAGAATNTYSITTTANLTAGNLAVLVVAADNLTTTDGNNNEHTSVTDSGGNVWTKRTEFTNGQGAAAGGATVSIWTARITTTVNSGGTVTANFSGNLTARALTGWQFSFTGPVAFSVAGSTTLANDALDPGNMTIGSLTSREYLWIRAAALEKDATAWTVSTNYTTFTNVSSTGAGAATNMGARGEFRIFTGTTDSSNPTETAVDSASAYITIQ